MKTPKQSLPLRTARILLWLYPKSFRDAFADEIMQSLRDLVNEGKDKSTLGLFGFWLRTWGDLTCSALQERGEEMKGRSSLLVAAIAIGLAIAWIDSRPHWDDTGISAGAIFVICTLLGAVSPKKAWQWALAVGVWIPLIGILLTHNFGAILALVPAFIGAYLGAGIRSIGFPPPAQA